MEKEARHLPTSLVIALFSGVFLLVSVYAFRGWIDHGADIFLTLAQNGMAWCL